MEVMQTSVKRSWNAVPFILLTFPVFVDIINGILKGGSMEEGSFVGTGFRGLIILFSLFFFRQFKYRRFLISIISLGIVCLLVQSILGLFDLSVITSFIKVLYAYFVLAILLSHRSCRNQDLVCEYAILYGVLAAISLLISLYLGIGKTAYGGEFGTRGFFVGMNDVTLSMLLLNGLSLNKKKKTHKQRFFFYSLIITFGSAFVGSFTAYLGTIVIFFAYILSLTLFHFYDFVPTFYQRISIILLIVFGTYFVIHELIGMMMEDIYIANKYEDIYAVIFEHSGRADLIDAGKKYIENRSILEDIFGSGATYHHVLAKNAGIDASIASAESDMWDIFGEYGLFMTLLLFFFPVKLLVLSTYRLVKDRSILIYWIFVISLLFVAHSFYAGHAIVSPLSMGYFMVVFYLYNRSGIQLKSKSL